MSIKNNAVSLILDAKDEKELEQIKIQILGKNGSLTLASKQMSKLSKEEREVAGKLFNETKQIIEDAINRIQETHQSTKKQNKHRIDATDPSIKPPLGHLHPVTQAIEEITDIFKTIGFNRVSYPEVEYDYFAFEALNFPENHPARDDWETFFVKSAKHKYGPLLLTPHTSNGQIRGMYDAVKNQIEPYSIKMLNIAKTYRRQSDISHVPMFHQFEGLVVGENISITHLKGTLDYFVKQYFGNERKSRIRPYHFQFTEPSFEVDISCGVCNGKGCKMCKAGWLELGGAGMIHPNVLKHGKIDSNKYSGFAFGFGVERILIMRSGIKIDDIRLLYNNDLDFLNQF